jgi:hypothetical protein
VKAICMHRPLCAFSLRFALAASLGAITWQALAQDNVDRGTTQELKKTDPVPPATGTSKPEQAGTQEPSTKGAGPSSKADVFVNGSLAVPGAPTDTQTAPAKFSERNAASDQLPTVAFRLKHLSGHERREVYQQLAEHRGGLALSPGGAEAYAKIGAELPADIVLGGGLTAVPDVVVARFPALQGTAFMKGGTAVLLVDLRNRQVIGVLPAP